MKQAINIVVRKYQSATKVYIMQQILVLRPPLDTKQLNSSTQISGVEPDVTKLTLDQSQQ